MNSRSRLSAAILLLGLPLAARAADGGPAALGQLQGAASPAAAIKNEEGVEAPLTPDQIQRIQEVYSEICKNYVDPIDCKKLFYGALRGMAETLDQYSEFMPPAEAAAFLKMVSSGRSFTLGISAEADKKNGSGLTVLYTIPGSPAEKAGVLGGDEVIVVDDVDLRPLSREKAAEFLYGITANQSKLTLLRGTPAREVTLTVARVERQSANVFSRMFPGGKGYLYFDQFHDPNYTTRLVRDEIEKLLARGAKSLILDIRHNGGGEADTADTIASLFLRAGDEIVIFRERNSGEIVPVLQDGPYVDLPLTVLVDEMTASASEILAAALQDHHRAKIIGTPTFGKGVAQSVHVFEDDGSALKLTVARWYRPPSNRSIEKDASGKGGVVPDPIVPVSREQEEKVLREIARELDGLEPAEVDDPVLREALK